MKFTALKKLMVLPISLSAAVCSGIFTGVAPGECYGSVEETESQEVIEITESIARQYPVCPELLQALIFYESSNRGTVVSKWGDIGYMQVNPKWQGDRMEELSVYDLKDGYGNILVGTDYLMELCRKYGDISLALAAYNGGENAVNKVSDNGMNEYAERILDLSEKLERFHGK